MSRMSSPRPMSGVKFRPMPKKIRTVRTAEPSVLSMLIFGGLLLFTLFFCDTVSASPLDFGTFRLGTDQGAVLIVGGIQGDEPGGFSAATLLATRYEIQKGSIWVVPNLNFHSIIKRSRGLHGDMNRKFARMEENDPEFSTVRRIQDLICDEQVSLVLNLHDGSGYYRPEYENKLQNPSRWGQSIIIDQTHMADGVFMGNLEENASKVASAVNNSLEKPLHAIHVHNTNTALGDREMEKSLSWYAVRHGKPAFGLEASKEFPTALRAYYHLSMVESFLRLAGVEFTRNFELTPAGIKTALGEHLGVSFADNRIFLPLEDARPSIVGLPLSRSSITSAITSKPIMAVMPCKDGGICIHYGNRTISRIKPEWREMDNTLDSLEVMVDGQPRIAMFGQVVDVEKTVLVKKTPGYRVNAIGADKGQPDESGIPIARKDFRKSYSLDKSGNIFRVEVYRGDTFAGMFLLRFCKPGKLARAENMPDLPGPESSLGF